MSYYLYGRTPGTTVAPQPSGGGTLLANFQASLDHTGLLPDLGTNNFNTTKNGVRAWANATIAVWPCDHPTAKGPSLLGGSHVYRINNNAGEAGGEWRFDLGADYDEVFMEYWVYFASGAESPSFGNPVRSGSDGGGNDKVFRLYNGPGGNASSAYDADTKYGMSMRSPSSIVGEAQSLYMEIQTTLTVDPPNANTGPGEVSPTVRIPYTAPQYSGRWTRHRIRCKSATVANNDGIMQVWLGNDLVLNRTDLNTYAVLSGAGVRNSFRYGYLFGFRNSNVDNSRIYIDNVTFSTGGFL
jgi:hypothetical protein